MSAAVGQRAWLSTTTIDRSIAVAAITSGRPRPLPQEPHAAYYPGMSTRVSGPDVLIIGAPKAGTSALHTALARHPRVFASRVKEPKYFMCTDAPPPAYRGPGDAHSQQEWVWRAGDYQALFADAPDGSLRLESTPFYLYLPHARRRLAEELPQARFIVVVRDPVDRAYSNWMHLWVDGLEPEADFVTAWRSEEDRIRAGWAPFWHYRRLGRYGEQLADLYARVERERILVLRYRRLVDEPAATLNQVCAFLGIETDLIRAVPADNSRPFVRPGVRAAILGRAIRAGSAAGSHLRPDVWRQAAKPFYKALQSGQPGRRPRLSPGIRAELVQDYRDDVRLLEDLLGEPYTDWLSVSDRGSFRERVQPVASR